MQAAVQAQDVKMIESLSLWEHTTKGNRSKEKLIKHVCEEAQNKSVWVTLLHQACIIALFQNLFPGSVHKFVQVLEACCFAFVIPLQKLTQCSNLECCLKIFSKPSSITACNTPCKADK